MEEWQEMELVMVEDGRSSAEKGDESMGYGAMVCRGFVEEGMAEDCLANDESLMDLSIRSIPSSSSLPPFIDLLGRWR